MSNISNIFFKYRSFTPIPFLLLMVIFAEPSVISMIIGFAIAISGELIRYWGVSWAGSETRTTGGVGGTYLVISGPFAFVRNPLYVGNILLYIGIGIMSWSLFPYLQLIALLFFAVQYHFIVNGEEKYLREKFGETYSKYVNNVPRFIPQFKPYRDNTLEQPPYNPKGGVKSEKRTLQAFMLVSLIIVIIWITRNYDLIR
jgi:protein-S-isoprenylcysteine O-methyltransferase Ste14